MCIRDRPSSHWPVVSDNIYMWTPKVYKYGCPTTTVQCLPTWLVLQPLATTLCTADGRESATRQDKILTLTPAVIASDIN